MIVIFCICSTQLFSQTIIDDIGYTFCDCWDSYEDRTSLPGSSLRNKKYIISWNPPKLIDSVKSRNDHFSRENYSSHWNCLHELYWCGCNNGGGESIIQKKTYYKNGRIHSMYEYDKLGNIVLRKCWDAWENEIECE